MSLYTNPNVAWLREKARGAYVLKTHSCSEGQFMLRRNIHAEELLIIKIEKIGSDALFFVEYLMRPGVTQTLPPVARPLLWTVQLLILFWLGTSYGAEQQ